MAASTASLMELHAKFARQCHETLDRDLKDDMPTDAATMSVIKGFLADNKITCDPAERDTTDALRGKFTEQQRIREERKQKSLAAVKEVQTGT